MQLVLPDSFGPLAWGAAIASLAVAMWWLRPEQPRPVPLIRLPRLYLRGYRQAFPRHAHRVNKP